MDKNSNINLENEQIRRIAEINSNSARQAIMDFDFDEDMPRMTMGDIFNCKPYGSGRSSGSGSWWNKAQTLR